MTVEFAATKKLEYEKYFFEGAQVLSYSSHQATVPETTVPISRHQTLIWITSMVVPVIHDKLSNYTEKTEKDQSKTSCIRVYYTIPLNI